MTFVFTANEAFEWPVEIHTPQGGSHVTSTITGLFEIVGDEEFLAPNPDAISAGANIEYEIDQLMRVFKGWKAGEIARPDGSELAVNEGTIREFLGQRPARLGVMAAYNQAITPTQGFRAKN